MRNRDLFGQQDFEAGIPRANRWISPVSEFERDVTDCIPMIEDGWTSHSWMSSRELCDSPAVLALAQAYPAVNEMRDRLMYLAEEFNDETGKIP